MSFLSDAVSEVDTDSTASLAIPLMFLAMSTTPPLTSLTDSGLRLPCSTGVAEFYLFLVTVLSVCLRSLWLSLNILSLSLCIILLIFNYKSLRNISLSINIFKSLSLSSFLSLGIYIIYIIM